MQRVDTLRFLRTLTLGVLAPVAGIGCHHAPTVALRADGCPVRQVQSEERIECHRQSPDWCGGYGHGNETFRVCECPVARSPGAARYWVCRSVGAGPLAPPSLDAA